MTVPQLKPSDWAEQAARAMDAEASRAYAAAVTTAAARADVLPDLRAIVELVYAGHLEAARAEGLREAVTLIEAGCDVADAECARVAVGARNTILFLLKTRGFEAQREAKEAR